MAPSRVLEHMLAEEKSEAKKVVESSGAASTTTVKRIYFSPTIKHHGKNLFFLDTDALVSKLEVTSILKIMAESTTSSIVDVLNEIMMTLSHETTTKLES